MREIPGSLKTVALFSALGLVYIAVTAFSPVKGDILKNKRINILLLGVSETDYAKFAEVIKLISYEPVTGFLDIVSIPRDTMISVPYEVTWKRIQKLDEVYARYYRNFGTSEELFEKFRKKIEKFLNNSFKIDYYIQVDYQVFTDFIDRLGGINIEVSRSMVYDDYAQDLHIHISTGIRVFGGEDALKYVRYRDKITGDIGRQERQHEFLRAVLEKMKSPYALPRIPGLIKAVVGSMKTNLEIGDIIILAEELRSFELKNFRIQKIPGQPEIQWGKSYWKADEMGLRETLDVVLNSQHINLPEVVADRKTKLSSRITAEVWNATNRADLARELTQYLRQRNVDVVRYGNYGVYKKYSQIISRTGDLKPVRKVAKIIGCRNIHTELDTSRMVDINIVIGSDFKPLWKE